MQWLAEDWHAVNQVVHPLWFLVDWDGASGRSVVLTGQRALRVRDSTERMQLTFTDVLAEEHGEWQLVSSHWSTVTEKSP